MAVPTDVLGDAIEAAALFEASRDHALQQFQRIHGIGAKKALDLVDKGYRSFSELVINNELLPAQLMALEHIEDFEAKIPRHEVEDFGRTVAMTLSTYDQQLKLTLAGSYRRGQHESGDIDILISGPVDFARVQAVVFGQLLPHLQREGIVKANIVGGKPDGKLWRGAVALSCSGAPWRRCDIIICANETFPTHLWYYTGSRLFNRGMERVAEAQGFKLDRNGLWVLAGADAASREAVPLRSEIDLFDKLGLAYRAPEDRNIVL